MEDTRWMWKSVDETAKRQNSCTFERTQCSAAPTLLYDSETWVIQKKNARKMNAVEMRSNPL